MGPSPRFLFWNLKLLSYLLKLDNCIYKRFYVSNNLLDAETKFVWYLRGEQYFKKEDSLVYCYDIGGLYK